MESAFITAVEHRRSIYALGAAKTVSEEEIIGTIDRLMLSMPSAYNCQSSRLVLLFGLHHICLWGIVKQSLQQIVPPDEFTKSREKIDSCFAAGCGTLLFYEDMSVIDTMKEQFAAYADKFDSYASQTSAMLQFAVWTALAQMGFGASLQHYNPLIDSAVATHWGINPTWRLMAQMPFGTPLTAPTPKEQHLPLQSRRLVFTD